MEVYSDYASIEEIAAKVGKSIVYLKNKIIPQMLANGLLEWQYPNTPRHPYQKYRTKKQSMPLASFSCRLNDDSNDAINGDSKG